MSGNPFRRTQASKPPEETLRSDESTPPPSNPLASKKKKVVNFVPQSPEEIPRRRSSGNISPPPPPRSPDDDDDSDSTATADSELEQANLNTRRNSGSLPPPIVSTPSTTGAPPNPFARTLATSEAQFGLHKIQDEETEAGRQDGEGQARHNTGRPFMDVDQFKNILMTGSAAPSPPVSTPLQRVQDSSSSTDTSSVSRQSLFDPSMLEIHPESPRTSFDQMESASEDEDDEGSNLMTGTARLDDMAPPAPPKHTHGKPVGLKGPQTVSFADFDQSIPSSQSQPHTGDEAAPNEGKKKKKPAALVRSTSDLNKPLPKTPPLSPAFFQQIQGGTAQPVQPFPGESTPAVTTTAPSPDQKKAPPPPPASRRTAQTGRTRSTSNPESIQEEEDQSQPKPTQATTKGTAPPPPPSRKARPISQTATPTAIETPPSAPSPAPATEETKTMPPPPPRRNPSKTGNSVVRSPSSASRSSASRVDAPATTTSHTAPPAPPPRRGAKSNRDSTDGPPSSMNWALNNRGLSGENQRRGSGNSVESERSTSLSNLQHVAEAGEIRDTVASPTVDTSSQDILADMTAFQAEIDALRAKQQNGG